MEKKKTKAKLGVSFSTLKSNVLYNLSRPKNPYEAAHDSAKEIGSTKTTTATTTATTTTTASPTVSTSHKKKVLHRAAAKKVALEDINRFQVTELTDEDLDKITELITEEVRAIFNVEDYAMAYHLSYVSHKLTNYKGDIVGIIMMNEFPNVPVLPTKGWGYWAQKLYNLKNINSVNTLWVFLAACVIAYEDIFIQLMLNNIFIHMDSKQYVLFVIPPGFHEKVEYLNKYSTVILPQGFTDPMRVQTLRLCVRKDFVIPYKIRRAVEEDNDDIVNLIRNYSPLFVNLYGDYYVAEILTRHTAAGRQIIVAEHKTQAVSVLCLNPSINYEELNKCFNLHVFTDLYKAETVRQTEKEAPVGQPEQESEVQDAEAMDAPIEASASRGNSKYQNWLTSWNDEAIIELPEAEKRVDKERALETAIQEAVEDLMLEKSSEVLLPELNRSHAVGSLASEVMLDESTDSRSLEMPFIGTANSFVIEILAALPNHHSSLYMLIISCFECYPTRDYCVLTIPHTSDYYPILKYFTWVPPKLTAHHPHDLYVCHRGQICPVTIQIANAGDTQRVGEFARLIKHPNMAEHIVRNLEWGLKDYEPMITFLVLTGKRKRYIAGLAQVSKVADLHTVKRKYALNQRSDFRFDSDATFGYIITFIMSPLFTYHINFFLREIHRKASCQTLLYALNKHDTEEYRVRPLAHAMPYMWLVPPRRQILESKKPPPDYPEEPYALFVSTLKLLNKPRIEVNHRIVVVGASETGLAFLEALTSNKIAQYRVTFNNVMLISKEGLIPYESRNRIEDMLKARHYFTDAKYIEQIALRHMIGVLQGVLTGINRKERIVTVNRQVEIPYDYLFLMTGLQYRLPKKQGQDENINPKIPSNCFAINTSNDSARALSTLHTLMGALAPSDPYEIVVYGHSIDCYCCIAALIEFGVRSDSIILVDPGPSSKKASGLHEFVFQDGKIYEKVVKWLERAKVTIMSDFTLIDWFSKPFRMKFQSHTRILIKEPLCAFFYGEKRVDYHMKRVIRDCGLVFDGRLVITPECNTSDPVIYAAGPLTTYPRRLWANHMIHRYFNSRELGTRLGITIRQSLLPFKEHGRIMSDFIEKSCQKHNMKMQYYKPLMTYCKLPGGLYYIDIVKPGLLVPLEAALCDSDYGTVYTTGDARNVKEQAYFRLHLNIQQMVETITCLSAQKFNYRNLVSIWGQHEALLNNFEHQLSKLYITDLLGYFQQSWCAAIFHDEFPVLQEAIMKVMTSATDIMGESPMEDLMRMYQTTQFKPLSDEQWKEITDKFYESAYEEKIEKLILNFIRDNITFLDMYAHPFILKCILSHSIDSPLFRKY